VYRQEVNDNRAKTIHQLLTRFGLRKSFGMVLPSVERQHQQDAEA